MNDLRSELFQSNEFAEQLKNAIVENKGMLQELQTQFLDTQGLQGVLVKYGNNPEGFSALHFAIMKGDQRVLELLLDQGADANASDVYYREGGTVCKITALHRAILANQLEIARILLARGADLFALNPTHGAGWSAIHFAAEVGNADIINLLVERGADVNADMRKDQRRPYTPLHIAARHGHYEAVLALVRNGADVDKGRHTSFMREWLQDRDGGPLDEVINHQLKYADNPKNLDLVKLLVENGAGRRYPQYDHIRCDVIKGYLQSQNR